MIAIAVAAPFAAALLAALPQQVALRRLTGMALPIAAAALGLAALPELDRLSGVFVALISVLSVLATIYSASIFPAVEGQAALWSTRPIYFILLGAFWSSMLVAVTAT
jgi:NADH:ubiquinone oxidoreductase subunit 5 (subunit L)/multisubunit Na+/H+ antiporter MnhA subunit